ncbi:MAG: hypothetical protein GY776_04525 [Alteromonas sp.]|nr:hypothetical protein [Alteromonas sp.]
MYKIPIKQILLGAFLIPWNEKALYTRALAPPVLALVSTWSIWTFVKPESLLLNYLFLFLYSAAFAYFAVTCHRLILVKENAYSSYNTIRVLNFTKWLIVIYGFSFALEMILLTIATNFMPATEAMSISTAGITAQGNNLSENTNLIRDFLHLPLMYLVGRFSLIFPATAVDLRASLRWSWSATRNNGLNILCVVGLLPWLLYVLLSFVQRDNSTIVEQAIIALLTYVVTAIGIFALSLTYRELQANAQRKL